MESEKNIEEGNAQQPSEMMRVGIAADHGGFELKVQLTSALRNYGYEVEDFGAYELVPSDDYPDFIIPLAMAVAKGDIARGLAICGSGVGACIVANKVPNVRASLIFDSFSAHQGVEDDDMNMMCLGGQITGCKLALELVLTFLHARFKAEDRFIRRLAKVTVLERDNNNKDNITT
jgi:ribose 5-phosphate isomerase B